VLDGIDRDPRSKALLRCDTAHTFELGTRLRNRVARCDRAVSWFARENPVLRWV